MEHLAWRVKQADQGEGGRGECNMAHPVLNLLVNSTKQIYKRKYNLTVRQTEYTLGMMLKI
jgi:hypothetical protein